MWTSVLDFMSLTKQENLKIFPVRIKNWKAAAETCQCFCPWEVSLWGPGGCGNLFCIYIYIYLFTYYILILFAFTAVVCLFVFQLLSFVCWFWHQRSGGQFTLYSLWLCSSWIISKCNPAGQCRKYTLTDGIPWCNQRNPGEHPHRPGHREVCLKRRFFFFLNVSPLNLLLWFFLFP